MKATFHCHSVWCDGRNTVEEMILAALDRGFDAIGFSSHAMFPAFERYTLGPAAAPEYVREIRSLAEKYRGRIRVLCALEADYIPGVTTPDRSRYAALGLDYLIGSVHWTPSPAWTTGRIDDPSLVPVDHTPEILRDGLRDYFGGDARRLIVRYHELLREMVATCDFDIVGHADLYRKYNVKHPFFDENAPWHLAELEKSADAIAASGRLVEVNTGAIGRGWRDDAYPSDRFRALLRERGVRFVLDSDSHSVETVDAGYDRYAGAENYVTPAASDLV